MVGFNSRVATAERGKEYGTDTQDDVGNRAKHFLWSCSNHGDGV